MLEPVVVRYRDKKLKRYFRADAAFASPGVYDFLEAEKPVCDPPRRQHSPLIKWLFPALTPR